MISPARVTKRDIEMFHDEFWNPVYFWVKRSKVKVTSHKNNAGVDLCTLVSAGFFWLTSMSVLLNVGPKCTLAASHAGSDKSR